MRINLVYLACVFTTLQFQLVHAAAAQPEPGSCESTLAGPSDLGHIKIRTVSAEFHGFQYGYQEATKSILGGSVGDAALALALRGWAFDYRVARSRVWHPSTDFHHAFIQRSTKGLALRKLEISVIRLDPIYSLKWYILLADIYNLSRLELDPDVIVSSFTPRQREAILFAYLTGPLLDHRLPKEIAEAQIEAKIAILRSGGFGARQARSISKALIRRSYPLFLELNIESSAYFRNLSPPPSANPALDFLDFNDRLADEQDSAFIMRFAQKVSKLLSAK